MRVIHETLRHTRGDKRLAAKLLGIATRTIYRRLEADRRGRRRRRPTPTTATERRVTAPMQDLIKRYFWVLGARRRDGVRGVRREGDEPRRRGEVPGRRRSRAEDRAGRRAEPGDADRSRRAARTARQLAARNMFCSDCTPPVDVAPNDRPSSIIATRRCRSSCSRPTSAPTTRTRTRRSSTPRTRARARTRSATRSRARPASSRRSTSSTSTSRTTATLERLVLQGAPPPATPERSPRPRRPVRRRRAAGRDRQRHQEDRRQQLRDRQVARRQGAREPDGGREGRARRAGDQERQARRLQALRDPPELGVRQARACPTATRSQSINGFELTSADKALEVYTKLRDATSLEVEITRRGKPMTTQVHDPVIANARNSCALHDIDPPVAPRDRAHAASCSADRVRAARAARPKDKRQGLRRRRRRHAVQLQEEDRAGRGHVQAGDRAQGSRSRG